MARVGWWTTTSKRNKKKIQKRFFECIVKRQSVIKETRYLYGELPTGPINYVHTFRNTFLFYLHLFLYSQVSSLLGYLWNTTSAKQYLIHGADFYTIRNLWLVVYAGINRTEIKNYKLRFTNFSPCYTMIPSLIMN